MKRSEWLDFWIWRSSTLTFRGKIPLSNKNAIADCLEMANITDHHVEPNTYWNNNLFGMPTVDGSEMLLNQFFTWKITPCLHENKHHISS